MARTPYKDQEAELAYQGMSVEPRNKAINAGVPLSSPGPTDLSSLFKSMQNQADIQEDVKSYKKR